MADKDKSKGGEKDNGSQAVPYERFKEVNDQRKALEAKLAEVTGQLEQLQTSQLDDVERIQQEMEQLRNQFQQSQAELESERLASLRLQIAGEKGLPVALANRIQGTTPEEIAADVETLLPLLKPATPGNPPPPPRQPPQPQFTQAQLNDPAFVRENKATIREADAAGQL